MAIPTLESVTDNLFETVNTVLEDPITYAIGGSNPTAINAWVEHEDKTDAYGGVQVTDQDITVEVLKSDVSAPDYDDVITLPQLGNAQFNPKDWKNNTSGRGWTIWLTRVRT